MPFRLVHAGATDVGVQRNHNEDSILLEPDFAAFVICDGMGGHASGAVASSVSVQTISESLRNGTAKAAAANGQEPLVAAILAANARVFQQSRTDPKCHGMGTTVVGIRLEGPSMHVCHIGDSRIYLLRRGDLTQMTRDHSLVNLYADHPELVGKLGPAHDNIIVRAVGLHENVEVEHNVMAIESGDIYMLCSDGLIDMVDDWMIREMMTTDEDLDTMTKTLIRAANNHGGSDNVSVILVRAVAE